MEAKYGRSLNEGRSVNPGDTLRLQLVVDPALPLNEGRSVNPGDTISPNDIINNSVALNEGRSVNPGDTIHGITAKVYGEIAQRRPGRKPRRHSPAGIVASVGLARSTKAGA